MLTNRTYRHVLQSPSKPMLQKSTREAGHNRSGRLHSKALSGLSTCWMSAPPSAIFLLFYLVLEVAAYQQHIGRTGKTIDFYKLTSCIHRNIIYRTIYRHLVAKIGNFTKQAKLNHSTALQMRQNDVEFLFNCLETYGVIYLFYTAL
jgi:hypothetical protein